MLIIGVTKLCILIIGVIKLIISLHTYPPPSCLSLVSSIPGAVHILRQPLEGGRGYATSAKDVCKRDRLSQLCHTMRFSALNYQKALMMSYQKEERRWYHCKFATQELHYHIFTQPSGFGWVGWRCIIAIEAPAGNDTFYGEEGMQDIASFPPQSHNMRLLQCIGLVGRMSFCGSLICSRYDCWKI